MSFLAGSPEKAKSSPTELQAARLYNRLGHELAGADNEDDYTAGEHAQAILRERFPGIENQAQQVTEPPRLSQKAWKVLDETSRTPLGAQTRFQHRAGRRAVPRTLRTRISHATAIHARPRPRRRPSGGGGTFGRAQQAAGGVGRTIVRAVEGVVALTLLGLLVSDRGSTAISVTGSGLGKFLGKLASPHDPLFTAPAPAKSSAASLPSTVLNAATNAVTSFGSTAISAGQTAAGVGTIKQIPAWTNRVPHNIWSAALQGSRPSPQASAAFLRWTGTHGIPQSQAKAVLADMSS